MSLQCPRRRRGTGRLQPVVRREVTPRFTPHPTHESTQPFSAACAPGFLKQPIQFVFSPTSKTRHVRISQLFLIGFERHGSGARLVRVTCRRWFDTFSSPLHGLLHFSYKCLDRLVTHLLPHCLHNVFFIVIGHTRIGGQ